MKLRGGARSLPGRWWTFCVGAALLSTSLPACNLDNPGVAPPTGALSYPVSITLSSAQAGAGKRFLYVANSNFDVRYNAGSVMALDVAKIEAAIDDAHCELLSKGEVVEDAGVASERFFPIAGDAGADDAGGGDAGADDGGAADAGIDGGMADAGAGDGSPGDAGAGDAGAGDDSLDPLDDLPDGYDAASGFGTLRGILCDGRDKNDAQTKCCFESLNALKFVAGEVQIPSFAAGMALRPDGKRLYVPVRGKNELLYIDVAPDSGELDCPGSGRCKRDADTQVPGSPSGVEFAPQPNSVAIGTLAQLGVAADDARADTVFVATMHERGQLGFFVEDDAAKAPVLQDSFDGYAGALRGTSVNLDPSAHVLLVTAANASAVYRYGVRPRSQADGRDLIVPGPGLNLTGLSSSADLRDAQADVSEYGDQMVYALVHGPLESVVFLRVDDTTGNGARVVGATRVGSGPSKITQTTLGGRRFLLVSCYGSRAVYVIDVKTRELVQVVRGFAGPFEMAVDETPEHERLYVADFGASVLRVVDIRGVANRHGTDAEGTPFGPPRIIATLGKPYYAGGL